jgi:hypothetical protein
VKRAALTRAQHDIYGSSNSVNVEATGMVTSRLDHQSFEQREYSQQYNPKLARNHLFKYK